MTPLEEYQIEYIEDTLRLVSNMMDAPKRDTCLKRMVMKCWNWVHDSLHDVPSEETSENGPSYYFDAGQTPYSRVAENGKDKSIKSIQDL